MTDQVSSVSIDMSPAFINGCGQVFPNADITCDEFHAMLQHWCTCVMRSKAEPMKAVAALVRKHRDGIVAWAQTRQTNGFLDALNGLFRAAKRRARGFMRMSTIRTVIFLIAGKLDFRVINLHAA